MKKHIHVSTLYVHVHRMKIHVYTITRLNETVMNLYIHCLYTSNTCTYNVCTCQIQRIDMFYDLHTVCIHHIYNFLPFCPMLVNRNLQFCTQAVQTTLRPHSYLLELAIHNYFKSGQSMSGSVQVVRILWLFSFLGKYIYIRVNTLYIHVYTCIYPKK